MNEIERIHEEAQKILDQKKQEVTPTELSILLQSQYFNIEEMFTFASNYKEENIDNHILIAERIQKLCNSYSNNLKLFPSLLSWENRKYQNERVVSIQGEINKSLELLNAVKRNNEVGSLGTMMELNEVMRKHNIK